MNQKIIQKRFVQFSNILPRWGPSCPECSSFCTLSSSVQEKGCFGMGFGGVLCTYISLKRVCDGRAKNRGWGWYSGQNETPSGQNERAYGQFVRKVGKSALELGEKNLIMPSTNLKLVKRIHVRKNLRTNFLFRLLKSKLSSVSIF